jgi:hypothetical protein
MMKVLCDVCTRQAAAIGDLLCVDCRERHGPDNPVNVAEVRRLIAMAGRNGERGVPRGS